VTPDHAHSVLMAFLYSGLWRTSRPLSMPSRTCKRYFVVSQDYDRILTCAVADRLQLVLSSFVFDVKLILFCNEAREQACPSPIFICLAVQHWRANFLQTSFYRPHRSKATLALWLIRLTLAWPWRCLLESSNMWDYYPSLLFRSKARCWLCQIGHPAERRRLNQERLRSMCYQKRWNCLMIRNSACVETMIV